MSIRRARRSLLRFVPVLALFLLLPTTVAGPALAAPSHVEGNDAASAAPVLSSNWTTYHDSSNRSGYTDSIPTVSSPSVNWTETLAGDIYGEPLVYDGITIVTTETDMVYAIDAATGSTVWSVTLGTPADSFSSTYTCEDSAGVTGTPSIVPSIGITSTPVIDSSTGTLYVAALDSGVGTFLYAIDLANGHTLWSYQFSASGFNYVGEEQRGALALANGFVYVPFGSYSWSCNAAFGWLFAVSANGNGTTYNFRVDTQSEGDIWAPEGVTVDSSGDLYVATGNSYYNATYNYADSVLKLSPDLTLLSYFAPSNWAYIGPADLDQDTTGVTLLPGNLAFSIGKEGIGYILNSTDLGGIGGQLYSAQVCRSPSQGWPYGAWGSTSYYDGVIYVPCNTGLIALSLTGGSSPSFTVLWNFTGIYAGPAIIAGGAVWEETIASPAVLYALNPETGAVLYQETLSGSDAHFSTPAAGADMIIVPDNETLYAFNPSSASGTSSVNIDSQNSAGATITGYRAVLYSSSGGVLSESFTPSTFSVTVGQTYGVAAESYGSCTFSEWSDGVTSDPRTFTATSSPVTFTAVYSCGTSPSSGVTVDSVNQNGQTITGYRTVFYGSTGSVLDEGFTPSTFTTTAGQTYGVDAESYGSCTFAKWSDGVTADPRSFTASGSSTSYTAVYDCASTTSTITVTTVNGEGATITGYYITLWEGGSMLSSCFSTCSFTVNDGQTYQVEAASYGPETFSHWQNDGATGRETVDVPGSSTTIELTAVYSP